MRALARPAALAWLVVAAAGCRGAGAFQVGADVPPAAADVVFTNGNIYTNGVEIPRAQALAVKDGRIVYLGTSRGAESYEKSGARVVDLKGSTVVPGFADSHVHLAGIGAREATLNLEGIVTLETFLSAVKAEVANKTRGEWITGRGWIETFWKPPVFPTRQDIDRVAPDNPVLLQRADGHASIANSAALRIAGIDRQTPNPFGGEILKDPSSGEPSGMLIDHAQDLLVRHVPAQTPAEAERNLLLGVRRELSLGWTEVQIAGNSWDEVELLRKLYRDRKIRIRIYDAVDGPGPEADRLLRDGPRIGEFGSRFTVRTIKIHYDGALGSRGAALLAPYSDAPESSGFLTQKEEALAPLLAAALRRGVQVETHAIGDRANRAILDLYEKAFATVPASERIVRDPRFRVEHAQIVHQDDIGRFAKLGVIPSMQPSHAISDLHFAGRRLGVGRLDRAYAWRRFLSSGSLIAGGSDAPVERGEPMIEFYAAVARKDLKGFQGDGWHPEQALSRAEALKALTLWPAYAAFEEKDRGSLEPGKFGDFTVLSGDIMQIAEAEIPKVRCLATVVSGEVVYRDAAF
jgi:predicted amidohydrolase YtcJ